MAAESSDGLGGPVGTRWRNMTGDIWYQLAPLAVFSVRFSANPRMLRFIH